MRYAIWNNKGGVGKTFLSFILSSEYAKKYPNKKILVVDMCPQGNLSEIFLGGNSKGAGVFSEFIEDKKTIGSYFDLRIKTPHQTTGRETEFFTEIHKYNQKIPDNMFLVVGDPKLEIQAQVMSQISSQDLPTDTWKNIHSWLLDLIIAGEKKYGENSVTFIDCNPSFSAYTGLAILASINLIVPCSSDGSSARAIDNLAALIYGYKLSDDFKQASFSKRVDDFQMKPPVIHSVLLNRSTQYRKKPSKAFGAMFDEIKNRTEKFKKGDPNAFSSTFEYYDIPDAHTSAVICSDLGIPISDLTQGQYEIQNEKVQINAETLNRYKEAIKGFLAKHLK